MSGGDHSLRVAALQLRTPADPKAAFSHLEGLVRTAAADGARLIATPEFSNSADPDPDRLRALAVPQQDDPVLAAAAALAAELEIWLLLGSIVVRSDADRLTNRSILLDDRGAVAATYDKMHMFDIDLPDGRQIRESATFAPGAAPTVVETPLARLGLSVCYDVRFPYLYRRMAQAGAQIITVPAAFTRATGRPHWEILVRARAIETGAFILAPAQGGEHEGGRKTWGCSLIVDPWGEVLAAAQDDEPAVLVADLDLAAVAKARAAIPAWALTPHEQEPAT
ncbi:MAG: amidohydrolase [Caulobacter sp.]|nr:amidohydrolase [Caulobacter sp.]